MLKLCIVSVILLLLQSATCENSNADLNVSPLHPPQISDRAFEGQILQFLEKIRGILKNGDPEQGIPPMEPLLISHYDLDFIIEDTRLAGYIDNLLIYNVSDFIVSNCEFNVLQFKLTLGLRFNTLVIDGGYKARGTIFGEPTDAEGKFLSNTTNLDVGLIIHMGSNLNRTVIKELDVSFLFGHDEIAYTNVVLGEENGLLDDDYLHTLLYRVRDEIFPLLLNTLTLVGSDLFHDVTLDELLKIFLDLIGGGGQGFISSIKNL